jgi:hypothetical protein
MRWSITAKRFEAAGYKVLSRSKIQLSTCSRDGAGQGPCVAPSRKGLSFVVERIFAGMVSGFSLEFSLEIFR